MTYNFTKLKQSAARLPTSPGVYIMKDSNGEVIYVGKAKNLRARVKTYFNKGDGRLQLEFLLKRVASLESTITTTERQAFILERDLITKFKPRYNIRLKDDKSYLSVRIDESALWPRLELVRKVSEDGAIYYGPYASGVEIRELLSLINRVVPLRTCNNTIFHNRQRPCLEYQIKRCCGPCCLPVDREQYLEYIKEAKAILEGRSKTLITELENRMERASNELRFEDAALLRDRIDVLKNVAAERDLIPHHAESRDAIALFREGATVSISIMMVRQGRVAEHQSYSFTDLPLPDEDVIETILLQFYNEQKRIPKEIVLPCLPNNLEFVQAMLEERRNSALEFTVPQRGTKLRLLKLAELNAKQAFAFKFEARDRYDAVIKELAIKLRLKQIPRKIECLDISNLQGTDIVAAIVAFFDGEPLKEQYRKYKITAQGKPDDFASIYETVSRRLASGALNNDLPDLLIIDGGLGQLNAALQAREEAKQSIEIIALAKMRLEEGTQLDLKYKSERVFTEGDPNPITLAEDSPATQLMKRIRDEAHRFVITFHRSSRAKRVFASELDKVSGLGPERIRRLLRHYGSLKNIMNAPLEELAKVGRMPLAVAKRIRHN